MSSITNFFDNLSIRLRIFTLIVMFFIILMYVWIVISSGMDNFSVAKSDHQEYNELLLKQKEIDYLAVQLRRHEKDFLLSRNLDFKTKYEDAYAKIVTRVSEIYRYGLTDDVRVAMDQFKLKIREHRQLFLQVVAAEEELGLNEKLGLQGALRAAVHEIEEILKTQGNDALTVKMLMMRRHEKDFIMRLQDKYVARIDARQKEFKEIMAASAIAQDDQSTIFDKLDAYVSSFKEYSKARLANESLIENLSSIYDEAVERLPAVDAYALEKRNASDALFQKESDWLIILINIVMLTAAVLIIPIGLWVTRSIAKQMLHLKDNLDKIADGEFETDILYTDMKNEMGNMSRATVRLREAAIARTELEEKAKNEIVEKAQRQQREKEEKENARREKLEKERAELAEKERKSKLVDQMINDFESRIVEAVSQLEQSALEMRSTSQEMVTVAEVTGKKSNSVRTEANTMQSNVNGMAASIEEFSISINEVNQQVHMASVSSDEAVGASRTGNSAIGRLSDASRKIEDIVNLISEIAEQTNLLALNATIEAARAGEAGRGFAVVATEVKALATQTANATDEISKQIQEMQSITGEAVSSIGAIDATINNLSNVMMAISSAVEEQQASTNEISRNVQMTSKGTDLVNTEIIEVSDGANRTKVASSEVKSAAESLEQISMIMSTEVTQFLSDVRSIQ